jgi:hypothetical protein
LSRSASSTTFDAQLPNNLSDASEAHIQKILVVTWFYTPKTAERHMERSPFREM